MTIKRILKFGGTSVGSVEAIQIIAAILQERKSHGQSVAIVVSALSGVTNELIAISRATASGDINYRQQLAQLEERHIEVVRKLLAATHQSALLGSLKLLFNDLEDVLQGVSLLWELSKRSLDFVMAFGERFSALIITEYLKSQNIAAEYLDAREFIFCDESFGSARVDFKVSNAKINERFAKLSGTPVVTGFIASTPRSETITLGRGGSDFTASILGAALMVEEIEIWTDVDGVLTADPHKVKKAFAIPSMSYEEAMELSHFGAKVIYPPTMQPALETNIPIRIRNTFNRACEGTLIGKFETSHPYPATGISSISSIALLRIQGSGMVGVTGVAMRVFKALASNTLNVILITQASSEHTICIAVEPEQAERACELIDQEFLLEIETGRVEKTIIERDLSIVSIVGENMRHTPGVSGKAFGALGRNGINIAAIAQGSSELNISVVIERRNEKKALNALHDGLFLSRTKTVNLFLVGTGLIGGTLLNQIELHRKQLKEERLVDLQLMGLARSKRMLISPDPLPFGNWNQALASAGCDTNLEKFVSDVIESNLENSVFIDCTADNALASSYARILDASIPIVSPNKKVQSGGLDYYLKLREISKKRNTPWLYETSVGAALPVIGTLRDLLKTGDVLISVEAVLSGTLSFLFNSVSAQRSFSSVVREAKELGLTEPDPRDDLSGVDMARKILILARESGSRLSLEDVEIESLLPKAAMEATSIDDFFVELKKYDAVFEKRRLEVEANNQKLRYLASFRDGKARLSLEAVSSEHPFFGLSGRDNMISFTTERYRDRPLVVRGPGAGAEVTAAGVFADIMRLVDQI
jgi:aspartokinase/homoserine dehydrogenase 1